MATTRNVQLADSQFTIRDGGYGWVNVVCCFLLNAVTWGVNTTFGVYYSVYLQNDYFANGTPMRYAYVGGLSVASCMLVAPFGNMLQRATNSFKIPLVVGTILVTLGQALAGISKTYAQLLATQGLLFGIGLGFTMVPSQPLLSQWFKKKLSYAQGLAAAGSGMGGLVLANTTRWIIENRSLKYALVTNGLVSLVVLTPCIILMKGTEAGRKRAQAKPFDLQWVVHRGYSFVLLFGIFALIAYFTALYTLAAYASSGLGLSQTEASALQSILAAGQMIGRPLCGLGLDWGGRHRTTVVIQILAGVTCFALWLPARSFAVLAVFAIFQGLFGGTVWSTVAPITAQVVGIRDLASALGVFWLAAVLPGQFGQPIAVALINYSTQHLHRTGHASYTIAIAFCGACFVASGLSLLASWRYVVVRDRNDRQQLLAAEADSAETPAEKPAEAPAEAPANAPA
jgi:MFS family permease